MKKFERKTKEERRRVLLNKNYESSYSLDNRKLPNSKEKNDALAKARSINHRFIAAFMALVFTVSCFVVGINFVTKAADGKDYESAYEIAFSSSKYTVNQSAIDAGLTAGSICKYVDSNNKYHAFTIPTDFTPHVGDTFTLDSSSSPASVKLNHDPRIAVGNESLEKLVDHVQDNGDGTFTIDSTNHNHYLSPDVSYWYLDPADNKTVYKLTPEKEYGYKEIELREEGERISANNGELLISLDRDASKVLLSGTQWYRHAIYERATTLEGSNIYLIVGVENGRRYMITYSNDTQWQGNYYDQDVFSGAACSAKNNGENVYPYSYPDKTSELIESSASSESDVSKQVLYASIGDSSPTIYYNYFDGQDGTVYQGEGDQIYDPYVYSEFSSYTKKLGDWFFNFITGGASGYPLSAYNGKTGYYTTAKAFGTYGTAQRENQSHMFIKYLCSGDTGGVKHYQGMIWNYANGKMYNNNNRAFAYSGFKNLRFSTGQQHIQRTKIGVGNLYFYEVDFYIDGFYGSDEESANEIEIYKMKNVYDKENIDDQYNLLVDEIKEAQVPTIELENATVFLSYDGADASEKAFTTNLSLKDDNNQPVTGRYPGTLNGVGHDFSFESGICNESFSLKDAQSIVITNIPYNYSIAVSTNADELANCQSTISQKDSGEGNPSSVIHDGDYVALVTDKEIDITIVRDTTFQLEVIAPEGVADAYAEFCAYYDSRHENGTQTAAYFKGTYGGDVNFVGDNETFPQIQDNAVYVFGLPTTSNIEIPEGYGAATSVDRIRIFTRVVAGFQEGVNPDKYTVTASLNDKLDLYTSHTAYTNTGDGWRTNNTTGTDQLLDLKTDNKLRITYQGIDQHVTIKHQVDGSPSDKAEASTLKMKMTLLSSENGVGVPLTAQDTNGNSYVFGNDGVCASDLSLSDNETVTLVIPYGYYLKVEDSDDYTDKYSTLFDESQVIKVDEGNSITVTHKRNTHPVIITEKTTGTFANLTRAFHIDLDLRKDNVGWDGSVQATINGSDETLLFENGKLDTSSKEKVALANGQSITLKDVPSDAVLTIIPEDAQLYTEEVMYKVGEAITDPGSSTIINQDNIQFTVTYLRDEVTDTGLNGSDNGSNTIIWLFTGLLIFSSTAGVAYVHRKRSNN